MHLTLKRQPNAFGTPGKLYVDDVFECDTLEDVVRDDGVKIWGQTAIPYGTYEVDITYSPRFKQMLPILLNVPNFTGIRIHPGNDVDDTEGCILTGVASGNTIMGGTSRPAFLKLFKKLFAARAANERVTISIVQEA